MKFVAPITPKSEKAIASNNRVTGIDSLYRDHHNWLFTWLRRKIVCQHQAADLTHDTFARLLALSHLPQMHEPRAYLVTVAKRLLSNQFKRHQIEQAYLAELIQDSKTSEGSPSPEHLLSIIQILEKISLALEGLAEKPRRAFLLHYLEGQTQAAIADQLGVSDRMVRRYLVQAFAHCYHFCAQE